MISAEIERWPDTPLTRELARHPGFINRDIFPLLADRYSQKQLLDELGLPTAPWALLAAPEQWPALLERLGPLAIVKRRTGGYDGRGQWHIRPGNETQLDDEIYGQCIVEQGINFIGEVSLIEPALRMAAASSIPSPITCTRRAFCAPAWSFHSRKAFYRRRRR